MEVRTRIGFRNNFIPQEGELGISSGPPRHVGLDSSGGGKLRFCKKKGASFLAVILRIPFTYALHGALCVGYHWFLHFG